MYVKDLSRSSLSTQKTRLLTYLPRPWHKMTSSVIATTCVASNLHQATKVRECYKNRILWYLHTVLTYQSHVTSLWHIFQLIPDHTKLDPRFQRHQIRRVTEVSTWETQADRRTSCIFSELRHESFWRQAEILIPEWGDFPIGELLWCLDWKYLDPNSKSRWY